MKNKKLPEIIITGTPQELVEIEPLLFMAGYDKVGLWGDIEACNTLILYNDRVLIYCGGSIPAFGRKSFKASEIHKILHYIETGEIKEYVQDKKFIQYAGRSLREPKTETHTGQAGVVGNKPVKLFESSFKNTNKGLLVKPTKLSPEASIKNHLRKMKLKKWKQVQKEFKQWADPNTKNSISYYSPTSQFELLAFFKKQFIK